MIIPHVTVSPFSFSQIFIQYRRSSKWNRIALQKSLKLSIFFKVSTMMFEEREIKTLVLLVVMFDTLSFVFGIIPSKILTGIGNTDQIPIFLVNTSEVPVSE